MRSCAKISILFFIYTAAAVEKGALASKVGSLSSLVTSVERCGSERSSVLLLVYFCRAMFYATMNRSPHCARLLLLHAARLGRSTGLRGLASSPSTVSVDNLTKAARNQTPAVTATTTSGPRRDPLDLTFNNAEAAFRSKSTLQVLRAYLVFTLCSSNYLVENNMKVNRCFYSRRVFSNLFTKILYWQLMKLGKKLLGKRLFKMLMKATFYGQFVAGEDQKDIMPTITRMRSFGVKSILDYSAEEDISEQEATEKEMAWVLYIFFVFIFIYAKFVYLLCNGLVEWRGRRTRLLQFSFFFWIHVPTTINSRVYESAAK